MAEASSSSIVWGVDISTTQIDIGWNTIDGSRRGVRTVKWPATSRGGRRLAVAREAIFLGTRDLSCDEPPIWVGVEQPVGGNPNPALNYMCGVIQCAIYEALLEHWHTGVEVDTVTSTSWKKEIGFKGNMGKPTAKKLGRPPVLDDYPVFVWANKLVTVEDWNQADGVGIAEYIRMVLSQS